MCGCSSPLLCALIQSCWARTHIPWTHSNSHLPTHTSSTSNPSFASAQLQAASPSRSKIVIYGVNQLTPCLQACSFRALIQVLCQCSLKDLKENRDDSKPLTPASPAGPPSLPERSLSRKLHTPPAWIWKSWCRGFSPLPSPALCLDLQSFHKDREYWNSHPSTISTEAKKRVTRHSQLNSWSSISASWSVS